MSTKGMIYKYWEKRAELLQVHAELFDDDQALQDNIEGETGITIEKIAERCADEIQLAGEMAKVAKARAAEMKARGVRLEASVEALREDLQHMMTALERDNLVTPTATITLKAIKRVAIVLEEADLPSKYWRTPDPTIDKKTLTADLVALEEGEEIKGAVLSEPGKTIQIRGA